MGVLQDFERRLEGAVEGFFARAFRSGLQPIELAKAVRRYAEDTQHITEDGVLVPNVYRLRLNPKDMERFSSYDESLREELAGVVTRTAEDRDWRLRGPALVRLESSEEVAYGMYELTARVEAVEGQASPSSGNGSGGGTSSVAVSEADTSGSERPQLSVTGADTGPAPLTGARLTVGRLAACDVVVDDPTVSREHAAFVRRGRDWWLVDLGSTNGTRVNGRSVSEQRLGAGDRIELGEAVLEVVED